MRISPIQNYNYSAKTYNRTDLNRSCQSSGAYQADVFISGNSVKKKNNINFTGNIQNLLSVIP